MQSVGYPHFCFTKHAYKDSPKRRGLYGAFSVSLKGTVFILTIR
jgi:hypothetical protein